MIIVNTLARMRTLRGYNITSEVDLRVLLDSQIKTTGTGVLRWKSCVITGT
ncbi:MAG: hypothetical protein SFV81_26425 [Pirellulaceae bacterium]|nr:hypothetical protein [Pirellulaceae bacterium]